jgi:hypothetical protein
LKEHIASFQSVRFCSPQIVRLSYQIKTCGDRRRSVRVWIPAYQGNDEADGMTVPVVLRKIQKHTRMTAPVNPSAFPSPAERGRGKQAAARKIPVVTQGNRHFQLHPVSGVQETLDSEHACPELFAPSWLGLRDAAIPAVPQPSGTARPCGWPRAQRPRNDGKSGQPVGWDAGNVPPVTSVPAQSAAEDRGQKFAAAKPPVTFLSPGYKGRAAAALSSIFCPLPNEK